MLIAEVLILSTIAAISSGVILDNSFANISVKPKNDTKGLRRSWETIEKILFFVAMSSCNSRFCC